MVGEDFQRRQPLSESDCEGQVRLPGGERQVFRMVAGSKACTKVYVESRQYGILELKPGFHFRIFL